MTIAEPVPPPVTPLLYDVEGAAFLLGVNKGMIYREIHAGNLAALRIGKAMLRIPHDAVLAYIEARLAEFQ